MSESRNILVIDDDRKLCRLIGDYLQPHGFKVVARHTGPEGLEAAVDGAYEAVLLDVMLPGMDGFEVLKQLRQRTTVPVLMLTAMGEEADRIVGLEMGADDYLPKTFSTRELLARLRAVTRRGERIAESGGREALPDEELEVGGLCLNEGRHTATMNGDDLDLTPLEFAILASLLRAKGRVKTREQLIDEVSQRKFDIFDRSIDVHISALRKKLGDEPRAPRFIRTVRAVGYQLIDPRQEPAS